MAGDEFLTRQKLKKDTILKMKDEAYQSILDGDKVKWFETQQNKQNLYKYVKTSTGRMKGVSSVENKRVEKKQRLSGKEAKNAKERLLEARKDKAGMPVTPAEQDQIEKILRGQWGKENWMTETHGGFTNLELIKQINEGNHSNFEKLDGVMRDLAATKFIESYKMGHYKNYDSYSISDSDIETEVDELEEGNMLFNPLLRLGLSQFARQTEANKRVSNLRRLDNAIAKRIMVRTLTFKMNETQERRYKDNLKGVDDKDAYLNEQKKMEIAKRSQMAKQLMLMHMGRLKIVKDGSGKTPDVPMASVLAHCSRTMIITPNFTDDVHHGNEDEMWDSILKHKTKTPGYRNSANIVARGSSTHSLERRKVGEKFGKEKKVLFNFIGQTGMDVAIGGMGSDGVDGKMIDQNGSCGHVFGMHKRSEAGYNGAYLFGYESDSYGHTNQLGHTHDLKATGEKASSFLCHRSDEIGEKYGGRQADISQYSSGWIASCMNAIDHAFDSGNEALIKKISEKLCGNIMNREEFQDMLLNDLKISSITTVNILNAWDRTQ